MVEPSRTRTDTPAPPPNPRSDKRRRCLAQNDFIRSTRQEIDAGACRAYNSDWTNIGPSRSPCFSTSDRKVDVAQWYIKPMAVFLPDKIMPGFVPYCPRCKRFDQVDVSKSRWVDCPRVLYGFTSHRWLDTKRYPCKRCKCSFNGYNPDSIKLAGSRLVGVFPFHLTAKTAIDEDLYDHLVERMLDSPTEIHRLLASQVRNHYIRETIQYHLAASPES
jgi:hypothetical protein